MKRIHWIGLTICVFVLVVMTMIQKCAQETSFEEQAHDVIQMMMEESAISCKILIDDEMLHACELTQAFYSQRNYHLAWNGLHGPFVFSDSLLAAINSAKHDGLKPDDYHRNEISRRLANLKEDKNNGKPTNLYLLVDLDLLLTDAFFLYASHLLNGRVNPETIDPVWLSVNIEDVDMIQYLEYALDRGGIHKSLQGLLPQLHMYRQLRDGLAQYRAIAWNGGWPMVPEGPELTKGSRGYRVAALKARLMTTGDMPKSAMGEDVIFDDSMDVAVKRFQERHGILPDGEVGKGTLQALNLPAEYYVRQIEINMERWRWLPRNLGERHIFVNIADFEMEVVEFDSAVIQMPVVVGKYYRKTPIFSGIMTHLVMNPFWKVPGTIASKDIFPKVKNDRNFLYEKNIKIVKNWNDEEEIDPETINWQAVRPDSFPYLFRQDPGNDNALGRIKFMFPNKFDVYLHDTPSKQLFKRNVRAYSSGCIRIERPTELAAYLLQGESGWNQKTIEDTLESGAKTLVKLPSPIPVHLFYSTAWMDADGILNFRRDIYDRDERLANALHAELEPYEFE